MAEIRDDVACFADRRDWELRLWNSREKRRRIHETRDVVASGPIRKKMIDLIVESDDRLSDPGAELGDAVQKLPRDIELRH